MNDGHAFYRTNIITNKEWIVDFDSKRELV
jgi:hypothetical protein